MATPPKTAGATAKRGPGRPRKNPPTGPAQPQPITPDPLTTPPDDRAAQSAAEQIANAVAAAAAPKASASGGRPTTRQVGMSELAEKLAVMYEAGGMLLNIGAAFGGMVAAGNPIVERMAEVGAALIENADNCGVAMARWADTNDRVKKFLEGSTFGGGLLMVLAVHMPIFGALVGKPEAGKLAGDIATAMAAGPGDSPIAGNPWSMFTDLFAGMPDMSFVEATATDGPAPTPATPAEAMADRGPSI